MNDSTPMYEQAESSSEQQNQSIQEHQAFQTKQTS